jgi:uncharacterized protein YceK
MTVILIVLNLLLNTCQTIITTDQGAAHYKNSSDYIVIDEVNE